jgi:uncharacterized protein (DUF2252 family)
MAMLAACGGGSWEEARSAWLVDALVDDNLVWLSREPGLLATKYDVMAADPYDFMRGTAGVFYRDLERAGSERGSTAFVRDPLAASVLIVGDPHPENVGSHLPGPERQEPAEGPPPLVLEFNDFDAAGFGPYVMDVRRALLGMAALLEQAGCARGCRELILQGEVEAYLSELEALAGGTSTFSPVAVPGQDVVLDTLLEDVLPEGQAREALEESTILLEGGRRRFVRQPLDEAGNGLLPVTLEEREQVQRLLATYDVLPGLVVHDVARRYGVGVASLPAVRYAVVYDLGEEGPSDDAMLQMREVVDPPSLYTVPSHPALLFDSGAHRSVAAPELLWADPQADARMGALRDGAMIFKVQSWSSWFQSFDHEDIVERVGAGQPDEAALLAFADRMGRILAQAHHRSVCADGQPAGPVLQRDLEGRHERFVAERLRDAERDLALLLEDHRRFRAALRELGPLLGADGLGP